VKTDYQDCGRGRSKANRTFRNKPHSTVSQNILRHNDREYEQLHAHMRYLIARDSYWKDKD